MAGKRSGAWSPEARKKRAKTMAAKRAGVMSIPLGAIGDRPAKKTKAKASKDNLDRVRLAADFVKLIREILG